MSIAVIDYGSGNLKSAAKALEAAANNINLDSKIIVTSDPKIIKECKKIILPGQGSFRDCYLGIKKIAGLEDALNEFVLVKKRPIFGICVGMQLFGDIGYETQETRGFGWINGEVRKINNINKRETLMKRRTRSLLEELDEIAINKDRKHVVESRATHLIQSSINLLKMIKENFSEETSLDLEKRFIAAIKKQEPIKFTRGIRKLKNDN